MGSDWWIDQPNQGRLFSLEIRRVHRQIVFDRANGKCEACARELGRSTSIELFFGEGSTIAESWALCTPCYADADPARVDWIDKFVAHCIAAALADMPNATGYARTIDRCTALIAQIQHQAGVL